MAPTGPPTSAQATPQYLRLRDDLIVTPDAARGYLVEDPLAGRFHRLGQAEFAVAAQLDGRRSLAEAAQRAAQLDRTLRLAPEALEGLGRWLLAAELVAIRSADPSAPAPVRPPAAAKPFDPLFARFSLGSPDRIVARLAVWWGWLFSWPVLILTLLSSLWAGAEVALHWTEFTSSLQRVLCPDQHLSLLLCWLLLKVVHETGHATLCKRLGGEVRDGGLALLFFMPVPYVDVTSSWRFRSKWERMAVAAAGMYVEWLVAVLAIGLWSWSDSPTVRQACVYTVSLATVSTILFNANPLCRFDGYFLLSDWLEWPNLAAQGQQLSSAWVRRFWLGDSWPATSLPRKQWWWLSAYGLLAWLWRQTTVLTMAVGACVAYEGVGLLFMALVTWSWYLRPLYQSWRLRKVAGWFAPRRLIHAGTVMATLTAAMAALWFYIPWPGVVMAPGLIEYADRHVVRAESAGLVEKLLVADGQWVTAGQTLAILRNDELQLQLGLLENAYQQGEVRLRSLRQQRKLVDLEVEVGRQDSLSRQIAEQRRQVEALNLRSPAAGRVMARRLADLPGSFLSAGGELCTIAGRDREFHFAVAQEDVQAFAARVGQRLDVRLAAEKLGGWLTSIEPRATTTPLDPSLAASAGGPLPVVVDDGAENSHLAANRWRLVHPRFTAVVRLPGDESGSASAGQRGWAAFRPCDETVGKHLFQLANRWLHRFAERNATAK